MCLSAPILADGGLIAADHLALTPLAPAQIKPAFQVYPSATNHTCESDHLESRERAMTEKDPQKARFNKSIAVMNAFVNARLSKKCLALECGSSVLVSD